jgi:hypothetical protein
MQAPLGSREARPRSPAAVAAAATAAAAAGRQPTPRLLWLWGQGRSLGQQSPRQDWSQTWISHTGKIGFLWFDHHHIGLAWKFKTSYGYSTHFPA